MALRAGISLRRKQGRAALAGDALLDLPDTGDSPSLLVVKHEHRDKFRAALAAAVDALPPRDRALLKLHDLDGVGLAKLAVMHGVDRSTISRWLARARDAVYAETRRQLTARYGVDRADFDSFIDVIRSRFGASVHRMLES
jgi:RNA polymerase sigma-70 factor (ECF subfamily)